MKQLPDFIKTDFLWLWGVITLGHSSDLLLPGQKLYFWSFTSKAETVPTLLLFDWNLAFPRDVVAWILEHGSLVLQVPSQVLE